MIIIYKTLIDIGNVDAMFQLGLYYYKNTNHDLMKKYYLMVIELGYVDPMNSLVDYYKYGGDYEDYEDDQEYDLMKKNYLIAIKKVKFYILFKLCQNHLHSVQYHLLLNSHQFVFLQIPYFLNQYFQLCVMFILE